MGKPLHGFVAIASFGLLACQPMYAEKPDTLRAPKVIAKKDQGPDKGDKKQPESEQVTACTFRTDLNPIQHGNRNQQLAAPLVTAGTKKLDAAAAVDKERPRIPIVKGSITDYSDALRRDPFNAQATLGLARA